MLHKVREEVNGIRKNKKMTYDMKTGRTLRRMLAGVLLVAAMVSCTEQVDTSARYVFADETVYSYLSKPEV